MTRPRSWWIEEDNRKWYLYRTRPDSVEGTREPESAIVSFELYPVQQQTPDCLKVYFASGRPKAVQWKCFLWNKTPTCSTLRDGASIGEFVEKVNQLLDTSYTGDTRDSGDSETQIGVYEFNEDIDPHESDVDVNEQRKRRSQGDVPALHRSKVCKIDQSESQLEVIKHDVVSSFLGIAKIDIENLEVGLLQLREVDEKFLTRLKKSMLEFSDHSYQPLIVLTKTDDGTQNFTEAAANGFHYMAIGGIHNLLACRELQNERPDRDIFSSRLCLIYSNNLAMEAQLWLANKHNQIGELRHTLSVKEKIQLCHDMFKQRPEGDDKQWSRSCRVILGDENERTVKIFTDLASRPEVEYLLLISALEKSRDGLLSGQKLKDGIFKDVAPYQMRYLASLPVEAYTRLLQDLIDGEITMGSLKKESHLLIKLMAVQRKFLQLMNIPTWEEATASYPQETTRDMLLPFTRRAIDKTLPALKDYCNLLRAAKDGGSCTAAIQVEGARGFLVGTDPRIFDLRQGLLPSDCQGFSLIIINYPQEWDASEITLVINKAVSLNLNKGRREFSLAVLCSHEKVADIQREVRSTEHFPSIQTAFFYETNAAPNECLLTPCLHGMVLGFKGEPPKQMKWEGGSSLNILPVETEKGYTSEDGSVRDRNFVSSTLYTNLVGALTSPGEWVLDACCGSGCGFVATVRKERNCLGVDSEQFIGMATIRAAECISHAPMEEDTADASLPASSNDEEEGDSASGDASLSASTDDEEEETVSDYYED